MSFGLLYPSIHFYFWLSFPQNLLYSDLNGGEGTYNVHYLGPLWFFRSSQRTGPLVAKIMPKKGSKISHLFTFNNYWFVVRLFVSESQSVVPSVFWLLVNITCYHFKMSINDNVFNK